MTQPETLDCGSHHVRASVIELIAGWLAAPPTEASVAYLQSPDGQALLNGIAEELHCHAAIAPLRAVLSAAPAPELALDIAVNWTRLFEGVMGAPPVSLYESAFAVGSDSPPGHLARHAVDEMNELLVRFDVSIAVRGEPADHIALQLALYVTLVHRDDAMGITLMRRRLAAWMPTWIALCQSNDPNGFYGAAASLLGVLLEFQPGLATHASEASQEWSHHAE